jgi:hypothetical protein
VTCFLLGGLLLSKWIARWRTGYQPERWGTRKHRDWLTIILAILTVVVVAYIAASALNARADYYAADRRFDYHDCIRWLPHSYDSSSTWKVFWNCAALALFFWAARDWLLAKPTRERNRRRDSHEASRAESLSESSVTSSLTSHELPNRLRLLLWVLCLNGAVLALVSILQRLSGTNKLLWLVLPHFNTDPLTQFGPFAYRANAATYFNLVWPISLGFWLALSRSTGSFLRSSQRVGSGSHMILLPGAILMAACPIISTSRGGALVAVGSIVLAMAILLWSTRKEKLWLKLGTCMLFALILGFSAYLGFKQLAPRFKTIFIDQMSQRTEIYENALPIAREFPVFGTGPGTFATLYQLYLEPGQVWHAYLHDDWLETRITFGWIGFGLILLAMALPAARWFIGPGINCPRAFIAMIWTAMAGCLLHAKFDFPMQVYSILLLFVLVSAILFCLSNAHRHA